MKLEQKEVQRHPSQKQNVSMEPNPLEFQILAGHLLRLGHLFPWLLCTIEMPHKRAKNIKHKHSWARLMALLALSPV